MMCFGWCTPQDDWAEAEYWEDVVEDELNEGVIT